jgi:3-hydroxybutyryl-CoA dehydrogenase
MEQMSTKPLAKSKIVLAGESPLVDDLAALCVDVGHPVSIYLAEEVTDPGGLRKLAEDAHTASIALDVMTESLEAKRDLVRALDHSLPADAPLLTACLSVSATQVAAWAEHTDWIVGFGALPPVSRGSLIELALPLQGQAVTLGKVRAFLEKLGLQTAVVQDTPGLVLPRIVCCLVNEAAYALMDRVAEARDIDTAMKLGLNYPRGPLEWGDLIGLDVVLAVLRGLHEETGDDHFRPAPLLKQLVRAGRLGRKTGQGFYEHST